MIVLADVVALAAHGVDQIPRQAAPDRHAEEAGEHGDEIAALGAALFRGQAEQENAEERAVGVAEDAEHDRDDPRVGRIDHDRRGDRADAASSSAKTTVLQRTALTM